MFPIYLNGEFELSYDDWGFKQYNMIIDISNTNIYNIFYDKLMTIEPDETGNRFFSDDFLEKNQIYINGKKIIHANKDIFASNFIWIYIDDFFNNDILVGDCYYRLYPDRIELFEGETL